MSKKIALVGHCGPDSSYLKMAIKRVVKDAEVMSVDDDADLQRALEGGADLLLFNRLLESGFADPQGLHLIQKIRAAHPEQKMMLITNYDDVQAQAVAAGALPGFGKREIGSSRVTELLRQALG